MADLVETPGWEPGIYQWETTDPVEGGPAGVDNVPTRQLANRTAWLKQQVEGLGTDKQPLDATLSALAALALAADKLIYATGVDAVATTTLTAFGRSLIDDADAAAARATLGAATPADIATAIANLVASSPATLDTLNELATALGNDANFAATMTAALGGKQPLDATLTALAALATVADRMIYATGADAFATTPLTAFARTLMDDADAATARATLAAAPLASPALTGVPTAPTAAGGTNTTQLATTAFVQAAVTALINASPAALDTLNELAAALGNDANFAATMTASLALKAPLASPAFTGTPTVPTAAPGTNTMQAASTAFVKAAVDGVAIKQIQPIAASVAGNALTLTLNPTTLDFRSSAINSGAVNTRAVAAPISLVISSGSTLGTLAAQAARLVLLAIDNAGTVELAVANLAGGLNLDETTLISTTAEGGAGAADSASVIYSSTARAAVPFRVVGFIDITEGVAGTWATAPAMIQGAGGQALAALSSLGYGQVYQDVTASRALGTTYYNTTGKPIWVTVKFLTASSISVAATVGGVLAADNAANAYYNAIFFIVPPGKSYVVAGTSTLLLWSELR